MVRTEAMGSRIAMAVTTHMAIMAIMVMLGDTTAVMAVVDSSVDSVAEGMVAEAEEEVVVMEAAVAEVEGAKLQVVEVVQW